MRDAVEPTAFPIFGRTRLFVVHFLLLLAVVDVVVFSDLLKLGVREIEGILLNDGEF